MKVCFTQSEVQEIEAIHGPLEWIEITSYGDPEPLFLLQTGRCPYCGSVKPEARCIACGAGVRAGSVR